MLHTVSVSNSRVVVGLRLIRDSLGGELWCDSELIDQLRNRGLASATLLAQVSTIGVKP